MATINGIKVEGYNFNVDYDGLIITYVTIGNGGANVWPILADRVRLAIFDKVFKDT